MQQKLVVPPDPARMMEGLRDTGYEFNTALADIIDNSIAANASLIDVHIELDFEGQLSIHVADNGIGMDQEGLKSAMKYGSPPRPDPASLGKFGLGLKTASTAFSRRLSVISRPTGYDPSLSATWDLDHVCEVGQWELLLSAPTPDQLRRLEETAGDGSGTLVVWEKVDRLMKDYAEPGGIHARRAVQRIVEALLEHIAMVYQRFLDPDDSRARSLTIRVNGKPVRHWDPFLSSESDLVAQQAVVVQMDAEREAAFEVRAFVLPRREEINDEAVRNESKIGNERQGIYVYRENRLIHGPDWLGMFSKEPHFSLARVEFSFDHRLDDAFHIDIKKSKILLNEDLYTWLREQFLGPPRRAAEDRSRRGQRKRVEAASKSAHDVSNNAIASKEQDLDTAHVEVLNANTGQVRITNRNGQVTLKLKVTAPQKPGELYVQPVSGIDDGILWEPALISSHKAVRINTGHPYYHKVYVPNLAQGVTVQGMDSLLWALCAAELNAVSDQTRNQFSEIRFEVSRLLRALVSDLPEPQDENACST